MNNQVVFAAAGHGKTYSLCSQAKTAIDNTNKHVLLISYTNEGVRSLENEYRKQNGGVLDDRVIFKSWYSTLLSEFIKPYQCSLKLKEKRYKQEFPVTFPENFVNSIAFYDTEAPPKWYNQTHVQYYVNKRGDVVPDRTSHLAWLCNEHSRGKVIRRIQEIYSHIFIDELQDYAGWDLEVITLLFKSKIPITCVGDYKQATYRTNNSLKNKQYRDEKVRAYFLMLEAQGLCVTSYANTTRRFNQEICDFINTIHGDADSMVEPDPNNQQEMPVENSGVYMMNVDSLREYCEYYHPIILRYDKKAKVSFQHDCDVFNYGGSKGATYERVVIIPVSTTLPFIERQVKITSNQTRAKFYVACTRAKHSVVFAMENPCENGVFKATDIHFSDKSIPAYKFSNLPLYEQQLQEAQRGIDNLLNAIQQGILTKSTKTHLEELEATKEDLEIKIANEKIAKPRISPEFVTFWLHKFRKLDVRQQSHRKMLIDAFVNAIYLYDDKMVITFNYKDGTRTIALDDVKKAVKENTGSDLDCLAAPFFQRTLGD